MEDFTIKLAGVPIRIRCEFETNRDFFRNYMTLEEPLCMVEPHADDLERMQDSYNRMYHMTDGQRYPCSKAFLENSAIHALLAEKLLEYDVLLMHGSALSFDGEGYIFSAASGTGKSTHARLWREAFGDRVRMINDDKPMLHIGKDGVTVWGTPWNGKHHLGSNEGVPLRAIVKLERAETNTIRAMNEADAYTMLMRQALISSDYSRMMRIMELEKQLLHAADFYELGCNMEPEAAHVAMNGMRPEMKGERKDDYGEV